MNMSYEYIDEDRDSIRIEGLAAHGDTYVTICALNGAVRSARIDNSDVPAVAAELLKAAGQESVIIPKAHEEVERLGDELTCGGGPEWAGSSIASNPNWLRNKAANCIAIAEYIENKASHEAEAEKKLQERRDALSFQLNGGGVELLLVPYANRTATMRQAIDRIIELEDGK